MSTTPTGPAQVVPELGPLLGRLPDVDPLGPRRRVPLDDVRFGFVTELFELSGAAREFAATDDIGSATASLGRRAWIDAWERAVAAVAERVVARVDQRLTDAAAESRMPERRLARCRLDDEERRAIGLRLGVSGGALVAALDALDAAAPAAPRSAAALARWQDALGAAARKAEAAWQALESAADAEQAAWASEIERVRTWRRPRWPLWLLTLLVAGVACYVGLVLGGFVPVPPLLRPLAERWWRGL